MFGGETDTAEAAHIVAAARDSGVNFISTVDVYHGGRSEEIVGRLIAKDRDAWVLATEVGGSPAPGHGGLSGRWLAEAIDGSLRRLTTDRIDLWYLHFDDRKTPLEQTIAAIGDIIRAGKVRAWGFSNFFGWQIAEMVRVSEALGVPRPIAGQPLYHALDRTAERDYLPACAHFALGAVAYSPLARGVLTGKYHPDEPPPADSRAGRRDARMLESEYRRDSLVLAHRIAVHAERKRTTAANLAVKWVLNNELVTSASVGPRTPAQWQGYLQAAESPFDAEDESFFASLVPAGHTSTPGYSDPRYPFTGRRPVTAGSSQ